MPSIKNIGDRTNQEMDQELAAGGRFVIFQYAISLLVITFRRSSDIYFIPAGESAARHSWIYTLITCLLGWWGIPWGPIYSIGAIVTNAGGGKNVTSEVLNQLNRQLSTKL